MTFDKVKEIVLDCLKCDEGDITLNADLSEDLGADSLDAVDLIMSLEDEFDITFPEDAATKIKTVGDIVAYIDDKTK
ncbi:MAG: acyl carrier protein [Oscillospiraceae bacterium]|jgi:acyl carrier protein|nr:acyl carrier protein [Oscillospiraceae bacterium]